MLSHGTAAETCLQTMEKLIDALRLACDAQHPWPSIRGGLLVEPGGVHATELPQTCDSLAALPNDLSHLVRGNGEDPLDAPRGRGPLALLRDLGDQFSAVLDALRHPHHAQRISSVLVRDHFDIHHTSHPSQLEKARSATSDYTTDAGFRKWKLLRHVTSGRVGGGVRLLQTLPALFGVLKLCCGGLKLRATDLARVPLRLGLYDLLAEFEVLQQRRPAREIFLAPLAVVLGPKGDLRAVVFCAQTPVEVRRRRRLLELEMLSLDQTRNNVTHLAVAPQAPIAHTPICVARYSVTTTGTKRQRIMADHDHLRQPQIGVAAQVGYGLFEPAPTAEVLGYLVVREPDFRRGQRQTPSARGCDHV
mmetsp:Transcript_49779/g.132000  ORF Transcript_49779/g.132000 Transcript_49779/m.132000 type:complete len:362 (+) Transcript_49779:531-1616(+)